MKILLLNPPFLNRYSKSSRSPAVTKSGTIYFPLWLCYAAAVLDKKGHEIKIIDAPARSLSSDVVLRSITEFSPELVVIDTSTASIDSDLEFTQKIKDAVNTKVCLVGTHASACYNEILPKFSSSVDFIARHEYDYTLPEIAENLHHPENLKDVLGICFMDANNDLILTEDRPYIQNLDELPFVSEAYKKYLDIHDYFYAHVSYPTISIFSSRGCPSKCFYCMYSQVMFGKKYRKRSPQNLYDECIYIKNNFPDVKEILIDDDNFAVDQENVKEFCRLMINSKLQLKWVIQARVNLSFETMDLMKKAGCKLVVVGFESGNQNILDNMHKGITLQQSLEFNKAAKKAHMRVHGCFMVGNPGETKETMEETLSFAKKLRLDTVQFFPLMVYPGTEAYTWAKEHSYITASCYRDWLDKDGMHNCVISTEKLSSNDLVAFCNYARKQFYLRPSYIFMKGLECLTSKEDLVRTFKSFTIFKKYLFGKQ
jgi:anaerobic magnesium-protoporphyrin IX monomethyl ester cyclase